MLPHEEDLSLSACKFQMSLCVDKKKKCEGGLKKQSALEKPHTCT